MKKLYWLSISARVSRSGSNGCFSLFSLPSLFSVCLDWLVLRHLPPVVIQMIKHSILNFTVVVLNKNSHQPCPPWQLYHTLFCDASTSCNNIDKNHYSYNLFVSLCGGIYAWRSPLTSASDSATVALKQGACRPLHACRGNWQNISFPPAQK